MDGETTQDAERQDKPTKPVELQPKTDAQDGQLTASNGTVDIAGIMRAIPHRYPFLMIDRIVEMRHNHSAIGIKNVSVNENYFQGHFPGHPVMPGVLIIESMAQTAAVLVVETLGADAAGKLVYFMTIESAKFRRPVLPGDQLRLAVSKERNRGNVWKFHGNATVDGVSVAEATFAAMIMHSPPPAPPEVSPPSLV